MCHGGFYTVKYTPTYIGCVNFCWFSKRCKAMSWVRETRNCRLQDSAFTDTSPTTSEPRCISREVHTSQMGPRHPCTGRPCPDTHVCAPAEAASCHVCLPLEGNLPGATTTASTTATSVTTTVPDATTATSVTTTVPAATTTASTTATSVTTTVPDATIATSVTTTDPGATTTASTTATSVTTTVPGAATTACITATSVTTTAPGATTTTTSDSVTISPATSAAVTVTTASTTFDADRIAGAAYRGCYLDDADRMINDLHVKDDSMTHEWCLTRCRQGNYLFAGVEYYNHCFCGNSYDNVKYTAVSDRTCNTPCEGNSSQMCGGSYRLSLFQCT
ncbi:integumentary mucin C.1-like [Haliotis cracherodii]|uniref:integumentary mucin C.1-like n=1 Tax=Haliotis cracherodii TaxID=6455 RepID=UPI0039EB49C2